MGFSLVKTRSFWPYYTDFLKKFWNDLQPKIFTNLTPFCHIIKYRVSQTRFFIKTEFWEFGFYGKLGILLKPSFSEDFCFKKITKFGKLGFNKIPSFQNSVFGDMAKGVRLVKIWIVSHFEIFFRKSGYWGQKVQNK